MTSPAGAGGNEEADTVLTVVMAAWTVATCRAVKRHDRATVWRTEATRVNTMAAAMPPDFLSGNSLSLG
jgi:hypothetical protein